MFAVRTYGLTKRFGKTTALSNMTMDVPEGAVFALVGANGAGKTTALKTILRLIRPTSGGAEVLGVPSSRLQPRDLARIGYVSESQSFPEWMTVQYLLRYCREFYPSWNDSDAQQLVAQYNLPLDRKLKDLSRGMRMKAALASSLAYRPKLIVLDEPFSGLDLLVREQLIETVLERTPQATVLLASHDLSEIETFASHVAYLDSGCLRFTEDLSSLSDRFRDIEVVTEKPEPALRRWPGDWLNPQQTGVVTRFTDSRYEYGRTEAQIAEQIRELRAIYVHRMSLRAIFVALARAAESGRSQGEAV